MGVCVGGCPLDEQGDTLAYTAAGRGPALTLQAFDNDFQAVRIYFLSRV